MRVTRVPAGTKSEKGLRPFEDEQLGQSLGALGFEHDDTAAIQGPMVITVSRLEGFSVTVAVGEEDTFADLQVRVTRTLPFSETRTLFF